MRRSIERRRPNGTLLHLETPEFGLVMKNGEVLKPEAWKTIQERKAQTKTAPKKPQEVKPARREDKVSKRMDALEGKLDSIAESLAKLTQQNEK